MIRDRGKPLAQLADPATIQPSTAQGKGQALGSKNAVTAPGFHLNLAVLEAIYPSASAM